MTSPLQGILEQLQRAALPQHDAARSDGELLTLYLVRRDEAAFEGLVRRHGPMVYGVCRRVLRSDADAEDAFQATFLVFIRKAASIRPREKTANWLYGVAYHTAQRTRDAAMKRRVKERQASENPRPGSLEDIWGPLLPLLDQEIHRLPENYRLAVVLCDLEGKSHKDAALQLGWLQGTLSGRLSRARALLRRRLARHGLAVGAGALAPSVGSAVPTALTTATVKAALGFAAGSAVGVVSVKVIALAEGVSKAMLLTKLQSMTAVLLAVTLAGVGTAVALNSMPAKEVRAPMGPDHAKAAPRAVAEAAPDPESGHNEWLAKHLREVESIKPGMTRADLSVIFQTEGGIAGRGQRRYRHRTCPLIKVDVTFEAVGEPDDNGFDSMRDKITKISKPFLEQPILD